MTILRSTDNPHELLDITCDKCRERLIATREEAHAAGWGLGRGGGYFLDWYEENDDDGNPMYEYVHFYDAYFYPNHFIDPEDD